MRWASCWRGWRGCVKVLDPEALSGPESLELFNTFHRIERLAAAGKVLCSRQMAASQAWYSGGHRSPCHLMAEVTGSSVRYALDLLDAAEAMKVLPATEAKFRSGSLTERQAIEVASAAVADPESEDELLEVAEHDSFLELQQAAARVRAAATDDEQRRRRAHRRRHLRTWVDVEGSFRFSGSLTPEAGAVLMAAIEPHRQALSRQAAESDRGKRRRRDSDAAVAADALVEMARCAAGSAPGDPLRPTPAAVVHVRVDHAALERGHTTRGEVCEVPGVGPVTVGWVQSLLPDAVVAALLVADGEVLKVAHLGRLIPAKVKTALVERDRVLRGAGLCRRLRPGDRPHQAHRRRRAQRNGQPVPAVPVPPLPQDPPRLAHLPSGQTLAVGRPPRPPTRPQRPPTRTGRDRALKAAKP